MTSQRSGADRDPHRRFAEWLITADADDEPPRDLAVHASLCAECQQQIAALDMLTAVDPSRAGMPPFRAGAAERGPRGGRVAVAVGGVAALAAIGVGGWRLIDAAGIGSTDESPTQAVLGNTGQPEVTLAPSGPNATESPIGSPSVSESASPSTVPLTPGLQTPGVPPVTPPAVTPRPTSGPTRTPRPSSAPPSPSPAPTASPTPTVPPPTPTPTVPPPTPEPTASQAAA